MILYNPKVWFKYIFRLQKGDIFLKLLPVMIAMCIYSALVAYLELEYWKLSATSVVKNLPLMHNLLGFAISMVLVFRTNTAYDRWWEGRKMWGALVNTSRNLALKLSVILPKEQEQQRIFFKKIIPVYAYALQEHLHQEKTRLMLMEGDDLIKKIVEDIDHQKHIPNQIAQIMHRHLQTLFNDKVITGEQLLYLNAEITSLTDVCGACERIKNTPIPYSYSVFIKRFVSIYIFTLPFGYVFSLGYLVVPVVAFIFYVLTGLEMIAEEIEDPFSGDANDVPTDKIADVIAKNVNDIL